MKISHSWRFGIFALALALVGMVVVPDSADAKKRHKKRVGVCTQTAKVQHKACLTDAAASHLTTYAFCINDVDERGECLEEASAERRAAKRDCKEQRAARVELCEVIGEAPYAPDMDPAEFQDPRNPGNPNPYFPLDVGNRWVYEEDGERIEIEIIDATKRIEGIDCIVYRDTVTEEGLLVEDTDDWFALRNNGDVVYCGEEVKDYEYFEGDDPEVPELTSIDGRFKAGEELAKAGISFLGDPAPGTSYRQEWDPGNAEDVGSVVSNNYGYGLDPALDELVPQALAEWMCPNNDCVVIADQSTLEPDAFEYKYYALGIGKFLETKPDDGEFVALVECNFDSRCSALPLD